MSRTPSGSPNGTQHGLLKASFIPSGPQRELRDLTRYRVRLTEEKAREVGESASSSQAALRGHVTDHHRFLLAEHLTQIRHLEQAIERVTAEITRRFTPPPPEETPASQKEEEATQERAPASAEAGESASSSQAALSWSVVVILLCSIPGIGERAAMGILAEIGLNMQQFPTAAQLARLRRCLPGQS